MTFILSYPIRSLTSRRQRTVVVVIGIALALSLPMVVGVVFDCMAGAIYVSLTRSVPDDVRLSLPPTPIEDAQSTLSDFVASSSLQPLKFSLRYTTRSPVHSDVSSEWADVIALDPETDWFLSALELDSGSVNDLKDSGVLVGWSLATQLRLRVGSHFNISWSNFRLEVEVVGVFHRLSLSDDTSEVVLSLGWLHASLNTTVVDEAGIVMMDWRIDVDTYSKYLSQLTTELDMYFNNMPRQLERMGILIGAQSNIAFQRQLMSLIVSLSQIAGVIATVAFVMVLHHEQMYEIALLKVVGMNRDWLLLPPLIMTLVLTMCSALFAVLLSVPMGALFYASGVILPLLNLLSRTEALLTGGEFILRVQPQSLITPIVFQLVVALLAGIYPALRSTRVPCVVGLAPRARRARRIGMGNRVVIVGSGLGVILSVVLLRSLIEETALVGVDNWVRALVLMSLFIGCTLLLAGASLGTLSRVTQLSAPILHGLEFVLQRSLVQNRSRSWSTSSMFAVFVIIIVGFSMMINSAGTTETSSVYLANGSDIVMSGYYPLSMVGDVSGVEGVESVVYVEQFDTAIVSVNGVLTAPSDVNPAASIRAWWIDPKNYSRTCRWEWIGAESQTWTAALSLMEDDPNSTILSTPLATRLGVTVNDVVDVWIGVEEMTVFNRSCRVLAVVDVMPGVESSPYPFVVLPLHALGSDPSTMGLIVEKILIRTVAGADVQRVVEDILDLHPGLAWDVGVTESAIRERLKAWSAVLFLFESLGSFALIVTGVVLAVVMMASVIARRFEFGVLRAIGMRWTGRLVVVESLTIGLLGLGVGVFIALTLWYVGIFSLGSSDLRLLVLSLPTISVVFLVVLGTSLLVGIVSSRYLERYTTITSLRRVGA